MNAMGSRIGRRQVLQASLGAFGAWGCRTPERAAPAPAPSASVREIGGTVDGLPTTEGAGVHLARTIGAPTLPLLDPFLLLDDIHSADPADYDRGFPRH